MARNTLARPRPLEMLLVDLDGVLRLYDQQTPFRTEVLFELDPGILRRTAFSREIINAVITGKKTKEEWIEHVGALVDSPIAVRRWLSEPGVINKRVFKAIHQVRLTGAKVAVLTNGTSNTRREMYELSLIHI